MTTREALLRSVLANPDDDTVRFAPNRTDGR